MRWGLFEFIITLILVGIVLTMGSLVFQEKTAELFISRPINPVFSQMCSFFGKNNHSPPTREIAAAKEVIETETAAALANLKPGPTRRAIQRRAVARTFKSFGIDHSPWPFETNTPFNTIEIRVGGGGSQGAMAALYILDGTVPPGVTMPLTLDIKLSLSESEKNTKSLLYQSLVVESLFNPILLDAPPETFIITPGAQLDVLIKSSDGNLIYYSGPITVQTPAPNVQTVFASKNVVVVRILAPRGEDLVFYPPETRDERYTTEFPQHMPVLTERGKNAIEAQLKLVVGERPVDRPFTQLIYSLTEDVVLDRSSYKSVAKSSRDLAPTRVDVIENPARPGEKYVVLRSAPPPPSNIKLAGWSIGFVGPDKGGVNVVFPSTETLSTLEHLAKDAPSATLYNTDSAVGVLYDRFYTAKDGGIDSDFFEKRITPAIVMDPHTARVYALVHSPVGNLPTLLLPHSTLTPIPALADEEPEPLDVSVLGGLFLPKDVQSRSVHLVALDVASSSLFEIKRVERSVAPSSIRVVASVPRTGLTRQTRVAAGKSNLMVLDGIADEEPIILQSTLSFVRGMSMMGSTWKICFSEKKSTHNDHKSRLVICRTTSSPATPDGHRKPQNLSTANLSRLDAARLDEVPRWALKGSWTGWGRHIFALSLREGGKFVKSTLYQILLTASRATEESQPRPNEYDHIYQYNAGAFEHARKALGADGHHHHEAVQQAASASDASGLWVLGADDTKCEKLLHDSFFVGPWGLIVFGSNPSPPTPADEEQIIGWRKRSPLSLGGPEPLASLHLPLRPVTHRLSVWRDGNPINKLDTKRALVRLEPHIVGLGAVVGLQFEPRGVKTLLQVEYNPLSGMVYSAKHIPFRWASSARAPSTVAEAESHYQILDTNQTDQFDESNSALCVITEPYTIDEGTVTCLVEPLVFLCIAQASSDFEELTVYKSLAGPDGPSYQRGMVTVPASFSALAGFELC